MVSPSASEGLKGGYYGYGTGEFVCFSLPSVADSGGVQGCAGRFGPSQEESGSLQK